MQMYMYINTTKDRYHIHLTIRIQVRFQANPKNIIITYLGGESLWTSRHKVSIMDTLATLFQTKTVNSWAAWQCVITAILPGYGITNNKEKQESWHESVTINRKKQNVPTSGNKP